MRQVTSRRRQASFECNLVIFDEPQLFLLKSGKSRILALATLEDKKREFDHIAVSVTARNWERYLDGYVDLRYLFTYPFQRTNYIFHSKDWRDLNIYLRPFSENLPNDFLPDAGLFSSSHTEPLAERPRPEYEEKLYIDGEWDLDEFGSFYKRYSDLYFFNAAIRNYANVALDRVYKGKITHAFSTKPFKGGSSYLHMFDELVGCLPPSERLGLDGIVYNSPGDVRINGIAEYFSEIEKSIALYVQERSHIKEKHDALRSYLSKSGYLKLSASNFNSDRDGSSIKTLNRELAKALQFTQMETLLSLCQRNELVVGKVLLAVYRRIENTAAFFAEGRMAFEREVDDQQQA